MQATQTLSRAKCNKSVELSGTDSLAQHDRLIHYLSLPYCTVYGMERLDGNHPAAPNQIEEHAREGRTPRR